MQADQTDAHRGSVRLTRHWVTSGPGACGRFAAFACIPPYPRAFAFPLPVAWTGAAPRRVVVACTAGRHDDTGGIRDNNPMTNLPPGIGPDGEDGELRAPARRAGRRRTAAVSGTRLAAANANFARPTLYTVRNGARAARAGLANRRWALTCGRHSAGRPEGGGSDNPDINPMNREDRALRTLAWAVDRRGAATGDRYSSGRGDGDECGFREIAWRPQPPPGRLAYNRLRPAKPLPHGATAERMTHSAIRTHEP
jgi:hypothetical protein